MTERYSRSLLRIAVAQICQNLGWNAIQSTPIELLTDILERYLCNVGRTVHEYSEQFGRTTPNLNDVGLAFHDLGINLAELGDYVEHVEVAPAHSDLPKFPAPRTSQLSFPAPNSRELKEREEHVHEHLPPMFPCKEDESPEKFNTNGNREGVLQVSPMAPTPAEKRPMSSPVDLTPPPAKRSRILPEEAAHSQYEMKGVMMTNGGLLTPTRGQGKLPDSRTPPPPTPGTTSASVNLNPVLTAPEEAAPVEAPPAVFTETVLETTITDDDPDYKPGLGDVGLPASARKKEPGKKGRPRGRGKGRGRSPKSPGRGRSPKGGRSASVTTPESKPRELFPEPPPQPSPEPPAIKVDPMEESSESPKLQIDEETGLQKEAAEAREKRLAAYDTTIDDVIKRVMSQGDDDDDEEEDVKVPIAASPERPPVSIYPEESLTSLIHPPPPPINENEEERQKRRSLEVQQELEHIQEKKKEWERQERQRIEKIERESRIDDTINDVLRSVGGDHPDQGLTSDDDHPPMYPDPIEPPPVVEPKLSPPQFTPPPAKEQNVFDFEDQDFSPPAIPDVPMSPQHEPAHEFPPIEVVSPRRPGRPRKRGRGTGRSPGRPRGSGSKVKDKLKEKLQKSSEEVPSLLPDWLKPKDEPLDLSDTKIKKEAPPPTEQFSISIPQLAKAAESMASEQASPLVQPLKIKISQSVSGEKTLKEEKEYSSKKEKKKKKNKDKDKEKDKDKDKSKEKKKEKKDKEKKKDKHDKEKKEKDKDGDGQSVPKLTFKIGGKSLDSDTPSKSDHVPKLVLKKPSETPPPPARVPTKAAMKQAPMANIPPPAPILRPPTPSPPSSPSLPPSPPPMESRVATPPPPSKFTSPPPPSSKKRDITPPPPPSSSVRSKPNPTPALTVETVGADEPARAVFTETVGSFYDENGDKVWICPACKMQDDGSPMVGCDGCDDWYHYPCVGIIDDPPENESWYCPRCSARRLKEAASSGRGGRGRKKRKKKQ